MPYLHFTEGCPCERCCYEDEVNDSDTMDPLPFVLIVLMIIRLSAKCHKSANGTIMADCLLHIVELECIISSACSCTQAAFIDYFCDN